MNEKRAEIEIEAIKTPVGEVPTVKTIERVIEGLNALGEDLDSISLSFSEALKSITAEVKSLQKLISKTTVSSEATADAVKRLERKFEQFSREELERWARLQQVLSLIVNALKEIYNGVDKNIKTTTKIEKLFSPFTDYLAQKKTPMQEKQAKPLKKVSS
ncbi:MAG: hypothetical protein QXK94_06570 [Candidatus Jordarchaeales archaeon]